MTIPPIVFGEPSLACHVLFADPVAVIFPYRRAAQLGVDSCVAGVPIVLGEPFFRLRHVLFLFADPVTVILPYRSSCSVRGWWLCRHFRQGCFPLLFGSDRINMAEIFGTFSTELRAFDIIFHRVVQGKACKSPMFLTKIYAADPKPSNCTKNLTFP